MDLRFGLASRSFTLVPRLCLGTPGIAGSACRPVTSGLEAGKQEPGNESDPGGDQREESRIIHFWGFSLPTVNHNLAFPEAIFWG